MKSYLPDSCVAVVYPEEPAVTEYLYFKQDGIVTTMANWLHGQLPIDEIEQLRCEIVIPHESSM